MLRAVTETAILGIAGLISTLIAGFGGILLGDVVQGRRARQQRVRDAGELVSQVNLEAIEYFGAVDAYLMGLAPEPAPLRGDYQATSMLAIAKIRNTSPEIRVGAEALSDAMKAATEAAAAVDPARREATRVGGMAAIASFGDIVTAEVDRSWWGDLRRWIERRRK